MNRNTLAGSEPTGSLVWALSSELRGQKARPERAGSTPPVPDLPYRLTHCRSEHLLGSILPPEEPQGYQQSWELLIQGLLRGQGVLPGKKSPPNGVGSFF